MIVPDEIEAYAEAHTSPPDPLLVDLAEETRATLDSPGMLTGPVEGRFLQQLVFALQAKRVLELGTFSGYSALSMAAGLPDGGHIDTCEVHDDHAAMAQRYIDRSPYHERITIHLGPALETIERLGGEWDFVFIDADKDGYPGYYDAVVPKLSPQGVIAVDNTLSGGDVVDPVDERDRVMAAFNEHVHGDERTESVVLSVRDGVTLIRRAS